MKLLAIETATRLVGCALWDDDGPIASNLLVAGQRHVEVLMPAIDELCRQAGISVADLDGVAVDVGPGLFTGLRVGLATATTIATARSIPAVGVTSLEALAHPHRRRQGLLAAVVDARRGEVYWALFEGDGQRLKELRAPAVAAPQDAAHEIANVLAVGDGAVRYREIFEAAGSEVAGPGDMWPSPLAVAELGMERIGGEVFESWLPASPPLPTPGGRADRLGPGGRASGRPCRSPPGRAQDGPMRARTSELGSPQVMIEPMRRRHLPAVIRIEHRAHPKPWSLGVFTSELAQGDARYYVVMRVDGKVVGYGGLMFVVDEAHVTNLAIAPSMRRQGLGTVLLAHLAREGSRRGCTAMTLEVRVGNIAAQDLYRKFGFEIAGLRRNYYLETGEDALIMWLYRLRSPEVQARLNAIEEL